MAKSRPRKPVPLPEARWPSAAEAEAARLYQPIQIGPLEVRERTWVPAMVPWRATGDGVVTPENLDWYGRFAAGRPGVLVAEATGIRDIESGPLLRISHDRFLPGLTELVARVRRESEGATRFFIQIIDFLTVRRRPEPARYFERYLQVSERHRDALAGHTGDDAWRDADEAALRTGLLEAGADAWPALLDARELQSLQYGYREAVNDLHLPHIRELPQVLPGLFADAADRARRAGFDGVELHFAHAYTMASFLSRTNMRDDGYGGSREGRARLALEVIDAVRKRVGDDYVVGTRFLGDEVIDGGSRIEDACDYAVRFADAGLDFLSVSKGGKFDDAKQPRIGHAVYPYTGPSGHECMPTTRIDEAGPFGRNLPLSAAIRRAVRDAGHETPVIGAGGICTFEMAEQALANGDCDLVAAARQSLADPDWFWKMRLGRGDEVVRCTYTNYCEGLDQQHKQVTCKLWDKLFDRKDPPPGLPLSPDGLRRLLPPSWQP
ncbi:MAG: NADH:flavin oxidoreductase [Planctomycetota bacterium]|nr:NADH:flavin oxidoreductase [Planctomycetota bacterium]